MGIGDGLIPDILDQEIYDAVCIVSDEEAISISRALALHEGLMCGVSSGTNVAAARKLARELGPGKTVVTILPDTGERYFSTVLFDERSLVIRYPNTHPLRRLGSNFDSGTHMLYGQHACSLNNTLNASLGRR